MCGPGAATVFRECSSKQRSSSGFNLRRGSGGTSCGPENDVVATIEPPRRQERRRRVTCGEQAWTVGIAGFFGWRVSVRADGSDTDLAVYSPSRNPVKGTLAFTGGRTFSLTRKGFWNPVLELAADDHTLLLQFINQKKFRTAQTHVTASPEAPRYSALPILLIMGFYLTLAGAG